LKHKKSNLKEDPTTGRTRKQTSTELIHITAVHVPTIMTASLPKTVTSLYHKTKFQTANKQVANLNSIPNL